MRGAGGRRLAAAVLVALAFTVGGCNDDKNDGSASGTDDSSLSSEVTVPTTASTTSTTAPPTDPATLALAAYRHGWDVLYASLNPPDARSPAIAEGFSGSALSQTVKIINDTLASGSYVVGRIELHPTVVSATETQVNLTDCNVEFATTYDSATNEVKEVSENEPELFSIRVVLQNGRWKVDEIKPEGTTCDPS